MRKPGGSSSSSIGTQVYRATTNQSRNGRRPQPDPARSTRLTVGADMATPHGMAERAPAVVLASIPQPARQPAIQEAARRLFDISMAAVFIIASSPIWLPIVAIAAALGRRPILYAQERVGRDGVLFRCWKFRTMRVDANEALHHLLATDAEAQRQWSLDRKLTNDPRVTRFGRTLRRFDLDELPQLLNVIHGEMSLIGPRPVVPEETVKFGTDLETVLSVKPGLTGAWQTSGRNLMSYEDRVHTEANYVRTRSMSGDIKICLRTVRVLIQSNSGR